jgi:dTDP-4-dehydrorhamnose 3,5-epimerase
MGFVITPLEIPDVVLIEPDTYADDRGFFRETFKRSVFADGGIEHEFVQSNLSRSRRHVLRGMHYQREPAGVGKLVAVALGRIFDVAADVRRDSPSFGRWVGAELSDQDGRMLYVPEGFAHGFCALADDTVVSYLMTGEFSPAHDAGVRWNDPTFAIEWPTDEPILSDKDRELPVLDQLGEESS